MAHVPTKFHSSSDNCIPQFILIKHRHEKQKLKFWSEIYNNEEYNQLFTMEELRRSLNRSCNTAVGPDKMHYQFLKHLSESSLRVLLRAFNKIWQTGQIPSSWQEATVIPIPKPGKDHSNPTNYRPIALTSCICKTMERSFFVCFFVYFTWYNVRFAPFSHRDQGE